MSLSWQKRKTRLSSLISADGEDAEGTVLDQLMHGQTVIGKTAKTIQIDTLRFSDEDLDLVGTLEYGQFGVVSRIDVVTCKLDGCLYVRKSTEKRFALKTRDQCSPQLERDVLLRARKTDSHWAPHLLCAFQTPTHLNLVMDYVEGGTLWDVIESSPHDGKVLEADLRWWAPQIVSAIHWCHSEGFVHRDIKPHNFVLTSSGHIRLIDFGSAAPLLPPAADGSQAVPLDHCLVPCGTCDYISPEVLQAHEEALVAMEMDDDERWANEHKQSGYGRETDWWSMGAMLYEMAYGIAPFFSREIRHTYAKIMEHHRSLKFDASAPVSAQLQDFLRRLLTSAELRLGRCDVKELKDHPFFTGINFENLHLREKPMELHVPQFTYAMSVAPTAPATSDSPEESQSKSRAFAFSALFQSSPMTAPGGSQMSIVQATPSHASTRSILRDQPVSAFIGFTWGPPMDAFDKTSSSPQHRANLSTPRLLQHLFAPPTPFSQLPTNVQSTPVGPRYPFATPVRPNALTPFQTLPRASTVRRTVQRRAVSDREAMKQLVDCVGMSARKKVLESGRKPRLLLSNTRSGASTLKELRFDRSVAVVGDGGISFRVEQGSQHSQSHSRSGSESMLLGTSILSASGMGGASGSTTGLTQEVLIEDLSSDLDSDVPPSPSPTPRPGSAMSILSRRSQTPTGSYFLRSGHSTSRSGEDARRSVSPVPVRAVPAPYEDKSSMTTTTMSFKAESTFSYEYLEQMERRYKRLMGDIAIVEGRLDEVSCMIRGD
ncbi:kinase-like protein [Dichomitus squalens]|uniref:non-specific serine/threonine protein kinase n=1 Tax=Dichomitus squalens TaxID=114155 RepID=A0A4Q9P2I9_9APHY|nr:kinase-like protein [Dichomitus squalens]TBU60492.1 kinase-like protein [Dichomitus squalens]